MAKYKVTEIDYDIETEDVMEEANKYFGIEDEEWSDDHDLAVAGVMPSDYYKKCEDLIDGILEDLPGELTIELDPAEVDDLDDAIVDAVSDKTGWLINSCVYEEIEGDPKETEENLDVDNNQENLSEAAAVFTGVWVSNIIACGEDIMAVGTTKDTCIENLKLALNTVLERLGTYKTLEDYMADIATEVSNDYSNFETFIEEYFGGTPIFIKDYAINGETR